MTHGQIADIVTDVPDLVWKPSLLGDRREPPLVGEKFDDGAYARLVLGTVAEIMAEQRLRFISGELRPRAGITLAPSGPLMLRRD